VPFPEAPRVLYNPNPLTKVICQFRFPPILRIDADIPALFQDAVRTRFPSFREKAEFKLELPPNIESQVPTEVLRQMVRSTTTKNYEFISEDELWTINLTRTFVALTTESYERWEQFKEELQIPFNALVDVYSPDHFSRIGLRYTDVINRSELGLDGVPWEELLKPEVIGLMGSSFLSENVINFESNYEIQLEDERSVVRIHTKFVEHKESGEKAYFIDSDFYRTGRTSIENGLEILDYFNTRASRLIRWVITDRLHNAMNPEEL